MLFLWLIYVSWYMLLGSKNQSCSMTLGMYTAGGWRGWCFAQYGTLGRRRFLSGCRPGRWWGRWWYRSTWWVIGCHIWLVIYEFRCKFPLNDDIFTHYDRLLLVYEHFHMQISSNLYIYFLEHKVWTHPGDLQRKRSWPWYCCGWFACEGSRCWEICWLIWRILRIRILLLSSDVWWMYRIYRFLVCFVVSLNRWLFFINVSYELIQKMHAGIVWDRTGPSSDSTEKKRRNKNDHLKTGLLNKVRRVSKVILQIVSWLFQTTCDMQFLTEIWFDEPWTEHVLAQGSRDFVPGIPVMVPCYPACFAKSWINPYGSATVDVDEKMANSEV